MKCPQKVYRPLRRSSSEPRRITDLVRAVAETLPAARDDRLVAVRRVAIVPALNEAPTIARVIEEIRAVDPGFEILVIDDGSTDGTRPRPSARVRSSRAFRTTSASAGQSRPGTSTRATTASRSPSRSTEMGSTTLRELARLLEPIAADRADMVIGSRFLGAGRYRDSLRA